MQGMLWREGDEIPRFARNDRVARWLLCCGKQEAPRSAALQM